MNANASSAVERWSRWLTGLSIEYGTFPRPDLPTTRLQFQRIEQILGFLREHELPTGHGVFPASISGLSDQEQASIATQLLPVFEQKRESAIAALALFGEEGEIAAGLRPPVVSTPTPEEESVWNELVNQSSLLVASLRNAVHSEAAVRTMKLHEAGGDRLLSSLRLWLDVRRTLRLFEEAPVVTRYWEVPRETEQWPLLALFSVCGGLELTSSEAGDPDRAEPTGDDQFLLRVENPSHDEIFDLQMREIAEAAGWSPDDDDDDDDQDDQDDQDGYFVTAPIVFEGAIFRGVLLAGRARVMDHRSFIVMLQDGRVVWVIVEHDESDRPVCREPPRVLAGSVFDYVRAVRDLCVLPPTAHGQ